MKKTTIILMIISLIIILIIFNLLQLRSNNDTHDFSYSSSTGPQNWAQLDPDFKSCAADAQSPINIDTHAVKQQQNQLSLNFVKEKFQVQDNGHTIIFNDVNKNSYLTYDDDKYYLQQFHFHSLSEHTINGNHYPLETDLVTKNKAQKTLVLSILFDTGTSDLTIFNQKISSKPQNIKLNPKDLVPQNLTHYQYTGSLTTPPCTEGVTWLILTTPKIISTDQVDIFNTYYNNNYRPIQKTNDRTIYLEQ